MFSSTSSSVTKNSRYCHTCCSNPCCCHARYNKRTGTIMCSSYCHTCCSDPCCCHATYSKASGKAPAKSGYCHTCGADPCCCNATYGKSNSNTGLMLGGGGLSLTAMTVRMGIALFVGSFGKEVVDNIELQSKHETMALNEWVLI